MTVGPMQELGELRSFYRGVAASRLKQSYARISTQRGADMRDVLRELETLAAGSMTDLGAQNNGSIWSTVRSDIDAGLNEDLHISLDGDVLKTLLNSGKPLFYGVLTGSSDEIHEMSRQAWGAFLKLMDHSCEHAVLVFTGPKEQLTVSALRSLVSGVMQALGISGSTLAVKLVPDPHLPVRLSVLMQ
nr:hypothetical protein [uncultured Acidovorax sp.]